MKPTGENKLTKAPVFNDEDYQTNLKELNGMPLPDIGKIGAKPF